MWALTTSCPRCWPLVIGVMSVGQQLVVGQQHTAGYPTSLSLPGVAGKFVIPQGSADLPCLLPLSSASCKLHGVTDDYGTEDADDQKDIKHGYQKNLHLLTYYFLNPPL